MNRFLQILLGLSMLLPLMGGEARAEVIDLGVLELDKEYALQDFKGYMGSYTATKNGVLTCESTTTDDLIPYTATDWAPEHMCSVTKNYDYGHHTYDFNVEAGKTYYFYTDFIMNSGTVFKIMMNDAIELTLEESSPALDGTYNVSNGGQISFTFNKAVSFTGATASVGDATKELAGQVSSNSIFFNDIKSVVWNWLTAGTAHAGDVLTLRLTGVCMLSDNAIKYGGDGTLEAHFVLGPMPITLIETKNTTGSFLSYYLPSDERGTISLTFSGPVNPSQLQVQLKYGDTMSDGDGEFYSEYLQPEFTDDGKTILINLQGRRRRPIDMVASGTDYTIMTLGIVGVKDAYGNYSYSAESGSMGSYWYVLNYEVVEANVVAEFTPANGANIENTKEIEVWVTDESKLIYEGLKITYTKDGEQQTMTIPASELQKEADPDDATAAIITFPVPSQLSGATDVEISFAGLQSVDGADYSNLLRVRYNAFIISRTSPMSNATMEKLNQGDAIQIFTNHDADADHLEVSLRRVGDESGNCLFSAKAQKAAKGFVATVPADISLIAGCDYSLEATAIGASGNTIGSDYVVWHGATHVTDGISEPEANPVSTSIYNLNGQRVDSHYRGIVIKGGRKLIR